MKKLLFTLLILAAIIAISGCINDEEYKDFEVLTPNDSTATGK